MSDINDEIMGRDISAADWLSESEIDVLFERRRQIIVEKFDAAHDDEEHPPGDLERAAAVYALYDLGVPGSMPVEAFNGNRMWPWDWQWLKPKTHRRNLVRATALLLAAIDKIDREAAKEKSNGD